MLDIMVVGGADTGRAPMVAVLLRNHFSAENIQIASTGVLGHDGDTWQPEARLALQHLGYQPGEHSARSLTEALAADSKLILAVDRGVGRALELRYNLMPLILPDLAGSAHEVPDPFRMPLDSWLIYARDLDAQIRKALPKIRERLGLLAPSTPANETTSHAELFQAEPAAIHRLRILVDGIAGLPEIIDWQRARAAMNDTLQALAASGATGDLRPAAVAMLQGVLGQGNEPLSANQLAILREATAMLNAPIDATTLGQLAGAIGRWQG